MKKRVLTLALVLAMCLSLAIPAFAANEDNKPETETTETTEKTDDAAEPSTPAENTDDEDAEPAESTDPSDEDAEPAESTEPSDEDAEPSDEDEESSEPAPAFTDVDEAAFYAAAVKWAVEKKITNGTEPTKFSPDEDCTQVQILTFLYRAARGEVDPKATPTAADMDEAVKWAKEKGMIDASFEAGKFCTRSTAVSYIWQAFGSPEAEPVSFSDVDAEADYAAAVSWALEKKVTNGTSIENNTFGPDEVCSRGQIVTFLYRAYAD